MKKQKWIRMLLAAALVICFQLPALAVEFGDSFYTPVALTTQDGSYAGNGMIISMTETVTYILTDSVFVENGEQKVLLFPTSEAEGYVECDIVWEDSYGYLIILATQTIPAISDYHSPVFLQPISAVSANEVVSRVFINLDEGDNPDRITTADACYYQETAVTGVSGNILGLQDDMVDPFQAGCPVINSQGYCVAIAGYTPGSDGNWVTQHAIGLDEVIRVLEENEIPYNQQAASDMPAGGSGEEDILKTGLFVAACIAGAFGFWYLHQKKKTANGETVPGQNVPVLVGQGGLMNERRFPLTVSDVRIGRDNSQCTVLYPEHQPGISACHCQVVLMNDQWLLIDMGSTHGTFVNGQRLEPGRPILLVNGSVFCLAGPQNSFRFEVR